MRVHEAFAKATVSFVMSVHPFVCIPYGKARLTFSQEDVRTFMRQVFMQEALFSVRYALKPKK